VGKSGLSFGKNNETPWNSHISRKIMRPTAILGGIVHKRVRAGGTRRAGRTGERAGRVEKGHDGHVPKKKKGAVAQLTE